MHKHVCLSAHLYQLSVHVCIYMYLCKYVPIYLLSSSIYRLSVTPYHVSLGLGLIQIPFEGITCLPLVLSGQSSVSASSLFASAAESHSAWFHICIIVAYIYDRGKQKKSPSCQPSAGWLMSYPGSWISHHIQLSLPDPAPSPFLYRCSSLTHIFFLLMFKDFIYF